MTDENVKQAVRRAWESWKGELAHSGIEVVEGRVLPDVAFLWSDERELFELEKGRIALAFASIPMQDSGKRLIKVLFNSMIASNSNNLVDQL